MPTQDIDVLDRKDTDTEKKVERPKRYQVVMFNDDYTPFEFVIVMLMRFFSKNQDEAMTIAMSVHQTGRGICGMYSKDVAETKVGEVMDCTKATGFPLRLEVQVVPD